MAAAGVISYSVRDSFKSYQPPAPPTEPRAYPTPRTSPAMSQSSGTNTSHHRAVPSQSSSSTPLTEDGSRMSLPSISNLLGIADANRLETTQGYDQRSQLEGPSKRIRYDQGYGQRPEASSSNLFATQDQASHAPSYTRYSPLIDGPPPTSSSVYALDMEQQKRQSMETRPGPAYDASPYSTKPYAASPGAASDGSVYSPTASMHRQMVYGPQGLQHAYPQAGIPSAAHSTSNLPAANPWEHHHYINSSAQQGMYPPLPDRYICQTCNKAFSRPSSLKIHSHSHTGEKPFKCPHAGCGKAFSVKSNMKRHEKGCHTGTGQAMPGAAYMGEDE